MTSQYRHRRTSTPATPFPTLEPGEIAVNTANRQISVGDAATPTLGTPKPLLAIRFFDSAAIYAIGDIVTNADKIWRAIAANGPGSFNAANWELAASQVTIAADPPSNAVAGSMWWDSDNGMLYVRYNDGDSSQWVQATAMPVVDTSAFVAKAGDTMTGELILSYATSPTISLRKQVAGTNPQIRGYNASNLPRWTVNFCDAAAEAGSNQGSNFQIGRFDDAGGFIDGPLYISRSTGSVSVLTDPTIPLGVATKQYVDARAGDAMAYSGMQINGGMEVSQERGTGGLAVTNASATIADVFRFAISGTGTVGIQQQTVAPPGFTNSVLLNCTTISTLAGANDYQWFEHRIEGYRWSRLGWGAAGAQPVTIGFWIQPPISGTMAVAVQTQVSPYRTYVVDVPVTAAAWQYKTVTIPGDVAGTWPKDNTVGAIVYFVFGVGSSRKTTANTWATQGTAVGTAATTNFFAAGGFTYITGVTVLPGTQAPTAAQSPLLMRPYDQELATCQRYYQKMDVLIIYQGYAAGAGAVVYGTMPYKVPMRSGPTITFPGATYFNASALAVYGVPQLTHFAFQYTISAAGAGFFNSGFIMDARL